MSESPRQILLPSSPEPIRRKHARELVILLLVVFAGLLPLAAHRPLANPDEGRYADIPLEMIRSGDWVTPRLNGVKYFEKPPLGYWIEAIAIKLVGPGERALRAPVVAFAIFGCLLLYGAARRLFVAEAGLAAAAVLATSLLYWAISGLLLLDMFVSVLITATLLCFIVGVETPPGRSRRLFFYGLYASAALATLSKGLIGFLLPGAVMFFWLLLCNQWRRLRPFYLPTGALLFLAIALPWHLLVASRNPGWAWFYFIHEHWLRFTTSIHGRTQPWWFFAPIVLAGMFPWTGFLVPAVVSAWRRTGKARNEWAVEMFLIIWAAFVFVFFSASGSKLVPYIVPVLPPLALLIGNWLFGTIIPSRQGWRLGWGVFSVGATVLGGAFLFLAFRSGSIPNLEPSETTEILLGVTGAILLSAAVGVPMLARRFGRTWALASLVTSTVAFYGGVSATLQKYDFTSTKPLAARFLQEAGPRDTVYHYNRLFRDFLYYTGRPAGLVDTRSELELDLDPAAQASGRFVDTSQLRQRWSEPGRVWIVARREDLHDLLADPTFHYHVCEETPACLLLCNREPLRTAGLTR